MQFHVQQAFRALLLLGFSAMLYMMHFSGEIHLLINPKYLILSQAAAFIFLIMFFIQITRVWTFQEAEDQNACAHADECCSHDHGTTAFSLKKLLSYSIIILPLITGFILPAKVLDSSIADKKGIMLSIAGSSKGGTETKKESSAGQPPAGSESQSGVDPSTPTETATVTGFENEKSEEEYQKWMDQLNNSSIIDFNDSIFSTYYEEISSNIAKYQGRKISLQGFVYKEEGFAKNQLVVSRFLVTHCVADASIIGFLSEFAEAEKIEKDTWIRIEGEIQQGTYMGNPVPLLKVSKWEEIKEPDAPYLYPISIRRN